MSVHLEPSLLAVSVIAALGVLVVVLVAAVAYLVRWVRDLDAVNDELTEKADMQGDSLREALNEIDRLRRARPGR